jgi:hypothetical protein
MARSSSDVRIAALHLSETFDAEDTFGITNVIAQHDVLDTARRLWRETVRDAGRRHLGTSIVSVPARLGTGLRRDMSAFFAY